jgi:hypothetical protein
METVLKTAPTAEPIKLDQVKRHLRLNVDDTDDDLYLQGLIETARVEVESLLWRKLITQTWYAYLQNWPSGNYIELPFGNLQSVTIINYTEVDVSSAATQTEWEDTETVSGTVYSVYIVGTDYTHGRVTLGDGYTWPSETLYPSNPIEIEFVCGYGLAAAVPAPIKQAMFIMIAELYENRESSVVGTIYSKIDTVNSLLANYRLNEL